MVTAPEVVERETVRLRPVARWVQERTPDGRSRLVMVWTVPDPHEALITLATVPA